MAARKPTTPNPAFPLTTSDELWSSIANGDHDRLLALLNLGLSPLGRLAGRFRNGSPESTSLWLLACEAPTGDLVATVWERLNDDERKQALTLRNGGRQTAIEQALTHGRAAVVEQLLRCNASLPTVQQQRWNGWALLTTHLNKVVNDLVPNSIRRDPAMDAALVQVLRQNGLLATSNTGARRPPDAFDSFCVAIRAGAVGCVDEILKDPIEWRPAPLNNNLPWSWLLLTCPAPSEVLGTLLKHGLDVALPPAKDPEVWKEFCRSFVLPPFRVNGDWIQAAAHEPNDLLLVDPQCRALLEDRILRATLNQTSLSSLDVTSVTRPRL